MSCSANRREERLLKACGIACALLGAVTLASCGSHETGTPMEASGAEVKPVSTASILRLTASENLGDRLMRLNQAVTRWEEASSIDVAHEAAEEARNLVVGETGPFYGDANRDGRVSGANPVGVLPGLQGEAGLARPNENVALTQTCSEVAGTVRQCAGLDRRSPFVTGGLRQIPFLPCQVIHSE